MIRWLRYKLARLWYWRHTCIALDYNWFTGRGAFWCGRCGGTIHVEDARTRTISYSTCPVGRVVQRASRSGRMTSRIEKSYRSGS